MGAIDSWKRYTRPPPQTAETRLSLLEKRYRTALSGAAVAKAHYLAQAGESFASSAALERAKWKWQRIDARRQQLADKLEDLQKNLAAALLAEIGPGGGAVLFERPSRREI
jgi:hypothetical protein